MVKRVYPKSSKILNFKFVQNEEDFFVEELPQKFMNSGAFIVLKVKKTNTDTWELIDRISKFLKIYSNEIGYAGLKDKRATTIQYITIPKKYAKEIRTFRSKKIEILDTFLHNKKLNIGDLKGNFFRINLHEVSIEELNHIQKLIKVVSKEGLPNYFGYQRFGKDTKENLEKAKTLIYGDGVIKDRKVAKMLISAYQSNFFNSWLVQRVKNSKQNFELLKGDVFFDIVNEKLFTPKEITTKIQKDFEDKKISPTGLLPGRKVFRSMGEARKLEEKYDDMYIQEKGYRREAIIFPQNITCNYDNENKKCTLEFSLPKGSYATVLIEYFANRNLS